MIDTIKWCQLQQEAAQKAGLTLRTSGTELKTHLERVGYVDVVVEERRLPVGPWPSKKSLKEAGALQLSALLEGIEGISLKLLTRFLGWKVEEVKILLAQVKLEWRSKKLHS